MSAEIATVWLPNGTQEGEYTQSNNPDLSTESSSDLLTESSSLITLEDSLFTRVPNTVWSMDDGA